MSTQHPTCQLLALNPNRSQNSSSNLHLAHRPLLIRMTKTPSTPVYARVYKASFLASLSHQFMPGLLGFKQSFKGDIVTPDDEGYAQAIARWAANAERKARIVAFVKDTDDVALALKYARMNDLQVAIRCGGHSTCGASSAEDGLVIDLSRYLDYAVVDPEKRTARVGGGSLWRTVENEAIRYGLATVAGRVNHVYCWVYCDLHSMMY